MSWITENIAAFLTDLIGGAIDFFGDILNNIFFWIVEQAMSNVYVINAEKFIVATAIALISLMVIKIVTSGYLLETDYDSEADPFNLIVKIAETIAIITNAGWIFSWMLETAKIYTSELLGNANTAGYSKTTKKLLEIQPAEAGTKFSVFLVLLVIMLIAFVIFTVVAGLRGAELIGMKLLMPYFALDLLTNSRERWNNFITAYLIAFFTYAFQILFFLIALKSYASVSLVHPQYYISTIIWIIMAIRAPKFLEKYIYKSGVSNVASSGIRMVAQSYVMRKAMV